jgi:4-amino-4-deoxy-L-arabinose transferase-like glycosyltransferase
VTLAARRLALVAALVAASAVVPAPLVAAPPVSDESAHLLGSFTVLDGGRHYVDFVDNKPPLLYAAYASAQALLGRGLGSVRLVAVLLVIPLTAFAASAFFGHDRRGVLAALLYVLLSAAMVPEDALPVHAELVMLLPAAWAVVLLGGRDATGRRPWPDVVAGGLLGVAALVKPTAALWLAAAPLALLLRERSAGGVRAA